MDLDLNYSVNNRPFPKNQSAMLKEAVLDYVKCMENTKPMMEVSGIKVISYEHFQNCVFTINEIIEKMNI